MPERNDGQMDNQTAGERGDRAPVTPSADGRQPSLPGSRHSVENDRHADDCLTEVSSSAAACSCGLDRARRLAERDAWQNGLEFVDMTQAEVDDLLEYSTTLPTGKTIGKRWKRYLAIGPKAGSWVLCEYVKDPDPAYVGITSHLIRVNTPPASGVSDA